MKIQTLYNTNIALEDDDLIALDKKGYLWIKSFDKDAYIRFASVYRAFEDMKTFEKEISKLKRK